MRKTVFALILLTVAGAIAAVFGLSLASMQTHVGFFAPAFGPEGRYLYFIERRTRGLSWGLGWEHFSPPANAYVLSDDLSLRRLNWENGSLETLESWDESPVKGRVIKEYRGRIFNYMAAQIRATEPDQAEYRLRMNIPVVPRSEENHLTGEWRAGGGGRRGSWEGGYAGLSGGSVSLLNGPWEVMTLPGRESFPAAIIAVHAGDDSIKVVLQNDEYESLYPDGPPLARIAEHSRRADIERLNTIKRTRNELMARFTAEGLKEGDAFLKVSKEMQRLGYYPKTPTITASRLANEGLPPAKDLPPLFEIAEAEMKSGIFPDIERAIAQPGEAADKDMGRYVIHRDYSNSARLNALLDQGGTVFRVHYRGESYELTIERP